MTRAGRTPRARVWPLLAILASFCAGVIVDGYLRTYGPPLPARYRSDPDAQSDVDAPSAGRAASGSSTTTPAVSAAPRTTTASASAPAPSARVNAPVATIGNIASTKPRVPIDGANVATWKGGFDERRGGGSRGHEAVDILAPRNTPVHAAENGSIAKIFESKQGGHTVYEYSADGRLIYYYAHLERYADGLHEGQTIAKGDVIGYVGTSGNAPPNTPHLHFAVFELGPEKQWWKGRPIDPYLVFTQGNGN
jgi:murein DD-endopeptidase MepM/ murein hydrolase activator NlpD